MKRTFLLFCSMLLLAAFSSFGQSELGLGGSKNDTITFVSPLSAGGFLVLGSSNSFTTDPEIFLLKTDVAGNFIWAYRFSAVNNQNEPIAACEANDGGYLVVFKKNGGNEMQIAKYEDGKTAFTWRVAAGLQINNMVVNTMTRLSDKSGYILSLFERGTNRAYVLRINNDGSVTKSLSEDLWDVNTTDVEIGNDGNVYLAGTTSGNDEIFLMKVDANLQVLSTKYFKSNVTSQKNTAKVTNVKIDQDADGNFIIAGYSYKDNRIGKVIIKSDYEQTNTVVYQYGLDQQDDYRITDVVCVNGGYVFTGYSMSTNTNSLGGLDILYLWCDKDFKTQVASIYGGKLDDKGQYVFANADKSVTIFSVSNSFSKNGDNDFYIVNTSNTSGDLCNQHEIIFTLAKGESAASSAATIYQGNLSTSAAAPFAATYTFDPMQFTNRCTCTQKLSFETSGSACVNEAVMFTFPSRSLAYIWDFGDGVIDSTASGNNFYIRFSKSGIRYISLKVNSGCFESSTKAVVIYPLPSFKIDYTPKSVCGGVPVNFSANVTNKVDGPWTYNWDFGINAQPNSSSAENPKGVTYKKGEVDTVSLTVADAHCSAIQKVAVSVGSTPVASFSTNAARCSGLPVSFKNTGTVGATYNWTFGDPSVSTSAVENPEATYNAAGLKTVQLVTSLGTCTDTAKETITVYATPQIGTITIAPSQAAAGNNFCEGSRFDASTTVTPASEHVTYSWDFGADAQQKTSTDAAPKAIVYTKAGTKTVSLTVQSEHCTSLSQTASVIVNAKPKADFASTSPQCTGEKVNFVSIGTAGVSYSWKFTTDATIISGAGSREVFASFATPGEKSIELVAGIGSCFDTIRHGLTINKTPVVNFTFDTLVAYKKHCAGDLVQLKNTGETGVDWNYAWNLGESAQPAVATTENPRVAYSFGGKKHITLKIASDYCSASIDTVIYIDTLPRTIIAAKGFEVGMKDIRICANTTVELSAATNNTTDKVYTWYLPTNSFETQKQVRASSVIVAPKAAETVYTLKTVDKNTGCEFTDSMLVVMLPAAIANAGVDVAICRGESIQIGAGLIEGQTYSWTPTASLSSITASNPVATPDSTTSYTLSVRYRDCPAETDQVVVTVHQLPKVQATDYLHKDSTQIARGESIQLIVIGALQYIWSPLEGLSNEGVYNPVASPENTTLYRVRGTDIFGCSNTDSIKVTVLTPKIWVPTAFTPNDDNLNEGFRVRGEGISKFELYVFTRAGEQVFYSKDQKQAWEGRKEGSNTDLPQGAYIYYTKGTLSDGALFEKRGVINLIR